MADIPPASAASSSSSAGAVAPSSNNIVIETTVGNVPDKIQQIARQIEVSGVISQPPAGNAITLNTVIGPLTLLLPQLTQAQQDKLLQQLMVLFQNQKALTVVMQPGNPPSQAFLLLPQLSSTTAQSLPASATLLPPVTITAPPAVPPNAVLSAIVLPGGASPSFVTAGQAGQVPYASFNPMANPALAAMNNAMSSLEAASGNVAATTAALTAMETLEASMPNAPQPNAAPLETPMPGINPNLAAPLNAVPTPGTAPPAASLFQTGAELNIRIGSVLLPNAPPNSPPLQAQGPGEFLATVAGTGPGGQIILKTGDASMFVRQPLNLPVGTQVLITAEAAKSSASALLTLPDIEQLPILQQVIAALSQVDPSAARAIMAMRVPQPGEMLPGALLFFLSAFKQGDVRSWLGNGAIDLLTRAGKAALIGKLAQELEQPDQTVRDGVVGDWRSYTVPLHDQGQFSVFHLYVHGDRERRAGHGGKDAKGGAPGQMRFLIDMRMSQLGAMQLDGFLRPKKLDIIVRSEHRLPPGLDNDLREGYAKTMEIIGYNGGLSFHTGRQGWLHIHKPAAGKAVVT